MEYTRPDIFISHDSLRAKEADIFQRLIFKHAQRPEEPPISFLSSNADSIQSGEPWVCKIFNRLRECTFFAGLIVKSNDFTNSWIPFEAAFMMGRGKIEVDIFVFGQIDFKTIPPPLNVLQLIDTGKTNRVWDALKRMGLTETETAVGEFAHLFRQCGCYRRPREACNKINWL